jgi:glycosyltransferase involved in cell wall biosynthesis
MFNTCNTDITRDKNIPLVTLLLLTYNQAPYVSDALRSALAQDYENLEIIISDDCSTDATYTILLDRLKIHSSSKNTIIRRNNVNLGLAAHINILMGLASGDLIIIAAGDDVSLPHRVSTLVKQWVAEGKRSGSIFSRYQTMNNKGQILRHKFPGSTQQVTLASQDIHTLKSFTVGTCGCTQAWTKDLFKLFGPLDNRILHEDITIPLRALLAGSVTYIADELVIYRTTPGTLSRASYADYVERFRKMARYWQGRLANYEQYTLDCAIAISNGKVAAKEIRLLNDIIKIQKNEADLNYRFFSGTFIDRVRAATCTSVNLGVGRRLKLLALAILPFIYGWRYEI